MARAASWVRLPRRCGVPRAGWRRTCRRAPAPTRSGRAQVARSDFFLKMLPCLDGGDDVGMVLSPQSFSNLRPHADIFNHGNVQFWEYAQHGYDAIGFISCTGARAAPDPSPNHSLNPNLGVRRRGRPERRRRNAGGARSLSPRAAVSGGPAL